MNNHLFYYNTRENETNFTNSNLNSHKNNFTSYNNTINNFLNKDNEKSPIKSLLTNLKSNLDPDKFKENESPTKYNNLSIPNTSKENRSRNRKFKSKNYSIETKEELSFINMDNISNSTPNKGETMKSPHIYKNDNYQFDNIGIATCTNENYNDSYKHHDNTYCNTIDLSNSNNYDFNIHNNSLRKNENYINIKEHMGKDNNNNNILEPKNESNYVVNGFKQKMIKINKIIDFDEIEDNDTDKTSANIINEKLSHKDDKINLFKTSYEKSESNYDQNEDNIKEKKLPPKPHNANNQSIKISQYAKPVKNIIDMSSILDMDINKIDFEDNKSSYDKTKRRDSNFSQASSRNSDVYRPSSRMISFDFNQENIENSNTNIYEDECKIEINLLNDYNIQVDEIINRNVNVNQFFNLIEDEGNKENVNRENINKLDNNQNNETENNYIKSSNTKYEQDYKYITNYEYLKKKNFKERKVQINIYGHYFLNDPILAKYRRPIYKSKTKTYTKRKTIDSWASPFERIQYFANLINYDYRDKYEYIKFVRFQGSGDYTYFLIKDHNEKIISIAYWYNNRIYITMQNNIDYKELISNNKEMRIVDLLKIKENIICYIESNLSSNNFVAYYNFKYYQFDKKYNQSSEYIKLELMYITKNLDVETKVDKYLLYRTEDLARSLLPVCNYVKPIMNSYCSKLDKIMIEEKTVREYMSCNYPDIYQEMEGRLASSCIMSLTNTMPTLNKFNKWVLKYEYKVSKPSCKNFQFKSNEYGLYFQFLKVAEDEFVVDVKKPLRFLEGIVLALTSFWQYKLI